MLTSKKLILLDRIMRDKYKVQISFSKLFEPGDLFGICSDMEEIQKTWFMKALLKEFNKLLVGPKK